MAEKNGSPEFWVDLELGDDLHQKLNAMAERRGVSISAFIGQLVDEEMRRRQESTLDSIRLAAQTDSLLFDAMRKNGVF